MKCTQQAKVLLPWAGKFITFCPAHANQLCFIAQAMGAPIQAKLLPNLPVIECSSHDPLTEEQLEFNRLFKPLKQP